MIKKDLSSSWVTAHRQNPSDSPAPGLSARSSMNRFKPQKALEMCVTVCGGFELPPLCEGPGGFIDWFVRPIALEAWESDGCVCIMLRCQGDRTLEITKSKVENPRDETEKISKGWPSEVTPFRC